MLGLHLLWVCPAIFAFKCFIYLTFTATVRTHEVGCFDVIAFILDGAFDFLVKVGRAKRFD